MTDEDKIDAERYRYLRSRAWTEGRDGGWTGFWRLPFLEAWNDSVRKDQRLKRMNFDEAVDYARKAVKI